MVWARATDYESRTRVQTERRVHAYNAVATSVPSAVYDQCRRRHHLRAPTRTDTIHWWARRRRTRVSITASSPVRESRQRHHPVRVGVAPDVWRRPGRRTSSGRAARPHGGYAGPRALREIRRPPVGGSFYRWVVWPRRTTAWRVKTAAGTGRPTCHVA